MAIKAIISSQFHADTIPDPAFVADICSGHDLQTLMKLSGLTAELRKKENEDLNFAANWAIVAEWSETSRYENTDATKAELLLQAILDPNSGVLPWIKRFW